MQDILKLILDEIRGAWRFRRWALVAAWAICILGWTAVLLLPNKYEATARVFVDPTSSLKTVVQGLAIEQDVNAELALVRQSLLGEPQLRKVISQTGLDARAYTPAQKAAVVDTLRDRIEIEVLDSGAGDYNRNPSRVYAIRYVDTHRDRAFKVVDILLNNLVEQTLGGKREATITAQKFLEEQIKDNERRLSEAEQRLADFKKQNVGLVPGQDQGDYFSRLQSEMDQVKTAQTALNLALNRREALQRQLHGEVPIAASTGVNPVPGSNSAGDTLFRIKETQAKLDELLLRFTDKHPDVVATRETLQQLKARREAELEALRRGDAGAAALTGASSNPVYQNIQLSLNNTEIEIANAHAALADHQSKVVELRRMLDTMPQVEAEYARLNRDYNVTKEQYTALVSRLGQARLGEDAEATGSVRFEVIDPPSAGYKPVSPKRLIMLAAVLIAGLGGGAAVAYLLNKLKPVFNDVSSLAEETGLRVLGAISRMKSDVERKRLRASYLRYSAATGALLLVFAVTLFVRR